MKIGISTSVIQRGKTGIASYLFALIDELAAQQPEHQFVLFVLDEDQRCFQNCPGNVELSIVPEQYRPAVKNILWHQTKVPGLARKLNLDLLHIPSYRRLVWNSPCPRVATIHDLAPFKVSGKYDFMRMFYGRVVVKSLAHRQEQIICVSQNTADDVKRFFGVPDRKLNVIHNGLDHERFFPVSDTTALNSFKAEKTLQKPFFLYVARLEHPGKNHVRLIEAFDQFKKQSGSDWQLVFGGSDWHGAEAIHNRAASSPYRDDIRSLGFVDNKDLPNLYRATECFVYPSLYEGFGMPPLEAMACGAPVISSKKGSLGEVVGNAALIVDPENVAGITAALAKLATDSTFRNKLKEAGFARAAQFNWRHAAAQTWTVYQKALGAAKRPAIAPAAAELSTA
ncbi:MAG: glycosyltransferase family 4 protein [Verrucomicrobiales bacterium]